MNRPAPWRSIMDSVVDRRPFKVGGASVDPVSRDARWKGGHERLQPQTLKVLQVLASRRGEVVTRDALVQLCWDGRIVGDDVINRSILLLRHFAERAGGFGIETVPRTGYRLLETAPPTAVKFPRIAARLSSPRGKRVAGAGAALLVVIAGAAGLLAFERLNGPESDSVMLQPFDVAGNDAVARTFAAGVSGDVNNALSAAGVNVVDPDSSGRSAKAAFVLSGRAERPDSNLHLTAQLQDASDGTVLWSTSFTRPAGDIQPMQEQVAANLAAVLQCAIETSRRQDGGPLDRESIKLYLKACALQQEGTPPSDEIQDLLQQVIAREPRFAAGWARYAYWAANAAFGASPDDAQILRRNARAAVQNALRLDPQSGAAYDAIAEMELGHAPFAVLHRQFQKVLGFDADDAFTINNECELLLRMGSVADSLRMCRRGVQVEPLSAEQASDLIESLIDNSHDSEAQAELRQALRLWPDDSTLRLTHLDYEARFGDPDAALAIVGDPEQRPERVPDLTLEAYRRLAEARKSPAQRVSFIAWLKAQVASGQVDVDFAAPRLAAFGDVDDAFRLAFAAPADVIHIDPEFLWEPESLGLRRDPRFIALARKFYVADFWHTTGMWPDFCSTPNWPYSCKAEDARLASARSAKA